MECKISRFLVHFQGPKQNPDKDKMADVTGPGTQGPGGEGDDGEGGGSTGTGGTLVCDILDD